MQMLKSHMKRCSTSLNIRKIQIKTTMKYYLTPIRMAIIKKFTNNSFWRRHGEKGSLLHCSREWKLIQDCGEEYGVLKKLKIELTYDPRILLLSIYPEETIIQKNTYTPMFIAALLTLAMETWKQPECPSIVEWIKKMWYIYTMEYHSVTKKK